MEDPPRASAPTTPTGRTRRSTTDPQDPNKPYDIEIIRTVLDEAVS